MFKKNKETASVTEQAQENHSKTSASTSTTNITVNSLANDIEGTKDRRVFKINNTCQGTTGTIQDTPKPSVPKEGKDVVFGKACSENSTPAQHSLANVHRELEHTGPSLNMKGQHLMQKP